MEIVTQREDRVCEFIKLVSNLMLDTFSSVISVLLTKIALKYPLKLDSSFAEATKLDRKWCG